MDQLADCEPHPISGFRGHYFDGFAVRLIRTEPDGSQFFEDEEEPGYHTPGCFLLPDQFWGRCSLSPAIYTHNRWKAIHEAGHAVICADEGIRVEFVTVAEQMWCGQPVIGLCCYDHRLRRRLSIAPELWNEKVNNADLGGPEAERAYWSSRRQEPPITNQQGWAVDISNVRERIAEAKLGDVFIAADPNAQLALMISSDIQSELERRQGMVGRRLADPRIWHAVEQVANRLQAEGAMDGEEVRQIMANAPTTPPVPAENPTG